MFKRKSGISRRRFETGKVLQKSQKSGRVLVNNEGLIQIGKEKLKDMERHIPKHPLQIHPSSKRDIKHQKQTILKRKPKLTKVKKIVSKKNKNKFKPNKEQIGINIKTKKTKK